MQYRDQRIVKEILPVGLFRLPQGQSELVLVLAHQVLHEHFDQWRLHLEEAPHFLPTQVALEEVVADRLHLLAAKQLAPQFQVLPVPDPPLEDEVVESVVPNRCVLLKRQHDYFLVPSGPLLALQTVHEVSIRPQVVVVLVQVLYELLEKYRLRLQGKGNERTRDALRPQRLGNNCDLGEERQREGVEEWLLGRLFWLLLLVKSVEEVHQALESDLPFL